MNPTKSLNSSLEVEITPTAPFNFDATFHKPDHFPTADNHWQPGVRWQTMRWQGRFLGLKFQNAGSLEKPVIRLAIFSEDPLEAGFIASLLEEIHYRYNLQLDLTEFNRRFRTDPRLEPILRRWIGMRPLNCNSLYEYLIIAIVLQNTIVRRSVSMLQALFERYGTRLVFDDRTFYSFWQPEELNEIAEEELRRLKVGYRAKAILRVSQAFARKEIDEMALRPRPYAEQRQALLDLYGIGPASVGYLLSGVFQHLDEMEQHISPWEQKVYSKLFFYQDPEDPVPVERLIVFFNERFSGYRNLAVHYVWEDLWWQRKNEPVEWLEKLIRL